MAIDPITLSTIAIGLASAAGSGILGNRADSLICNVVKQINEKFRQNTPKENQELSKAFNIACLNASRHICAQINTNIGGDNVLSIRTRFQKLLLGEIPVGVLSQVERDWLIKAIAYLDGKIKEAEKNLTYISEQTSEKYLTFFDPKDTSSAERAKEFQKEFTEDVINDLRLKLEEDPPNSFIEAMRKYWFMLACDEFQDAINQNQLLTNIFQNKTLAEISLETERIEITLNTIFNNLSQLIQSEGEKTRDRISASESRIIEEIRGNKPIQNNYKIVLHPPPLKEKIYDREKETIELLRALSGEEGYQEQFWLLIAPSGFGKSSLLSKALQEVTDGLVIKPEFELKVKRIIKFDCREIENLSQIVQDFNQIVVSPVEYNLSGVKSKQNWLNKYLFPEIQRVGTVWLILENFETWLKKDKSIASSEIQEFINALLEGNHNLRVLVISQTPPDSDIKRKLKELKAVGDELYKGLPEADSLYYLRTEGKEIGLHEVNEEILKEFLLRTAYIPQAMSSLIGYLKTNEGYAFEEFIANESLWQTFDAHESEADDGNLAKRRTKALIAKQIQSQPLDVKFLLSVLAFNGKSTPREILELFFEDKARAINAISSLKSHRLATVRVNYSGTHYYDLHTYFLEQSKKLFLNNIKNWFQENGFAYGERAFKKGFELHKVKAYGLSLEISEFVEKIIRFLGGANGNLQIAYALAMTLVNKSDALRNLSEHEKALQSIREGIEILDNLKKHHTNDDIRTRLASAFYQLGTIFSVSRQEEKAIGFFDEAIKLFRIFIKQGRKEFRKELALSLMGKASCLSSLVKSEVLIDSYYEESINNYDHAILILRQSIKKETTPTERRDLLTDLAMVLANKGFSLCVFNKPSEASSSCDEAISILNTLLNKNRKNEEFLDSLATAYRNKALALQGLTKYYEAMTFHNKAVSTWYNAYVELKWLHAYPNFLRTLFSRFEFCLHVQHFKEAALDIITAAESINIYLQNPEVSNSLKQTATNQFGQMIVLLRSYSKEDREKVYSHLDKAREMIEILVEQKPWLD